MNRPNIKAKTSVTLSLALLAEIDHAIGQGASRSAYIEQVLRDHLNEQARQAIQLRDRELINAAANQMNAEMIDILSYQSPMV